LISTSAGDSRWSPSSFQAAKAATSQLELAAQEAGIIEKKKSSQPVRGTGAWDDAIVKARGHFGRGALTLNLWRLMG
jgi:hypothetical protein